MTQSQSLFQIKEQMGNPLVLEVGQLRIPVRLNSLQFRRSFRTVLKPLIERHDELSSYPIWQGDQNASMNNHSTATVCKKALLYILSLKIDGECATMKLLNAVHLAKNRQHKMKNAMWWHLLNERFQPRMPIDNKHLQRQFLVKCAAQRCSLTLLKNSISEFECAVEEETFPDPLADLNDEAPTEKLRTTVPLPKSPTDTVKPARSSLIKTPIPWSRSDPSLILGKNRSFFNLSDSVHPMDLVHVAVFGATGSGKTQSVVIPFVNAAIDYQLTNKKKAAVFVLDPKKELLQQILNTLKENGESDRVAIIGQCPPIQLFTPSCELSATDRFLLLREFSPAAEVSGNGSYWMQQADAMLTDLIELEMLYFEKTNERFMYKMACELEIPNIADKGYWSLVKSVLATSCKSHQNLKRTDKTLQELFNHQEIISPALQFMAPFSGSSDLIEQWSYTVMTAQPMLSAFSDRSIEAFVDMDVIGEASKLRTQIEDLILQSKVIVYSPERTVAHTTAGKALKQRFYEAVFSREDLEKPIFVVLDEYQTFVSPSDTSLIDRCRAYRCVVLVCSQSISSLKHALGNTQAAQNIVEILTTNLPTTFTFRSNDANTSAWLRTQIPIAPDGGAHVLDIRRLANLAPGEAYLQLASGHWGRDQASLVN